MHKRQIFVGGTECTNIDIIRKDRMGWRTYYKQTPKQLDRLFKVVNKGKPQVSAFFGVVKIFFEVE